MLVRTISSTTVFSNKMNIIYLLLPSPRTYFLVLLQLLELQQQEWPLTSSAALTSLRTSVASSSWFFEYSRPVTQNGEKTLRRSKQKALSTRLSTGSWEHRRYYFGDVARLSYSFGSKNWLKLSERSDLWGKNFPFFSRTEQVQCCARPLIHFRLISCSWVLT